jgi:diadenosine tetraphosphatase ApaH/serine/threonine PP2A family protein phosphatase
VGSRVVVNPGSVGQPLDGNPEASYAVIQDGIAEIKRAKYDVERTIQALGRMNLPLEIVERLAAILRSGPTEFGSS